MANQLAQRAFDKSSPRLIVARNLARHVITGAINFLLILAGLRAKCIGYNFPVRPVSRVRSGLNCASAFDDQLPLSNSNGGKNRAYVLYVPVRVYRPRCTRVHAANRIITGIGARRGLSAKTYYSAAREKRALPFHTTIIVPVSFPGDRRDLYTVRARPCVPSRIIKGGDAGMGGGGRSAGEIVTRGRESILTREEFPDGRARINPGATLGPAYPSISNLTGVMSPVINTCCNPPNGIPLLRRTRY